MNVVSAQDDVNDPYYPFGKPDQLEVALMTAHVAQLTLPHELEQVFDMVTVSAVAFRPEQRQGSQRRGRSSSVVVSLTGFSSAPTLPLDAGGSVPRRVVNPMIPMRFLRSRGRDDDYS